MTSIAKNKQIKITKTNKDKIITKDDFIIFAEELMYVMDNIELIAYKRQLQNYKIFLLSYIKQWSKELHYVKLELKERILDLEVAELLTEEERINDTDFWELDGRWSIQ